MRAPAMRFFGGIARGACGCFWAAPQTTADGVRDGLRTAAGLRRPAYGGRCFLEPPRGRHRLR
eukprot:11262086-Alexandrium_andersonii.AAC.1